MKCKRRILIAMVLICSLAVVIMGCEKGEDVSANNKEVVTPAPMDEVARSADNDTSGDLVPVDETDTPEVIDRQGAPDTIDEQSGIIKMQNEAAVSQHRMGIVMFTHEKHYQETPDGHGINCGECHHDEEGKPLVELTVNDSVPGCFECHDKKDRPRKPQDISDGDWLAMRLEYYVEAVHENCIECHKEQGGPVQCTDCHPRP